MSNVISSEEAIFEDFPLSYGQQALWFLQDYDPTYIRHNLAVSVRTNAFTDLDILNNSFQKLVNRHPVLRTTFTSLDGKPVQRVHKSMPVFFQVHDAFFFAEP